MMEPSSELLSTFRSLLFLLERQNLDMARSLLRHVANKHSPQLATELEGLSVLMMNVAIMIGVDDELELVARAALNDMHEGMS